MLKLKKKSVAKRLNCISVTYHILYREQSVNVQDIPPPVVRTRCMIADHNGVVEHGVVVKPTCVQLCDRQYEQVGWCQPTTWLSMHALMLGIIISSQSVINIYIYTYIQTYIHTYIHTYLHTCEGRSESKERLRIQPVQLLHCTR